MKIVVTRPEEQAGPLVRALERLGHEVVVCPLIAVEALGDGPVDLAGYDWVVVTSPNGARELVRRARGAWPRVAAIGTGTEDTLAGLGVRAALVPVSSTQEGLVAEFPQPPGRVLVAAAEGARRLLIDELGADFVPLYRTRELRPERPPEGDLAVLASPSAARALAAAGGRLPVVSIGPQTTREARAHGLKVIAEAADQSVDGLVEAVYAAGRG